MHKRQAGICFFLSAMWFEHIHLLNICISRSVRLIARYRKNPIVILG